MIKLKKEHGSKRADTDGPAAVAAVVNIRDMDMVVAEVQVIIQNMRNHTTIPLKLLNFQMRTMMSQPRHFSISKTHQMQHTRHSVAIVKGVANPIPK